MNAAMTFSIAIAGAAGRMGRAFFAPPPKTHASTRGGTERSDGNAWAWISAPSPAATRYGIAARY